MPNDPLLTTAEAAKVLGRDQSTIARWARNGTLPTALRAPGIRGSRFFLRSVIEAKAAETAAQTEQAA